MNLLLKDAAYQFTEASEANFIERWKWPSSNEVSIKIVEEARKPPHHDFMVGPPFDQFSQHKFVMLLPQGW